MEKITTIAGRIRSFPDGGAVYQSAQPSYKRQVVGAIPTSPTIYVYTGDTEFLHPETNNRRFTLYSSSSY